MTISKEAIEAAAHQIREWIWAGSGLSLEREEALKVGEIVASAVLSTLPIAVEGKVKQLEWDECTQERSREDPNREVVGYEAGSPVGIFYGIRIEYDGFHASSENDHLGRFDDLEAAKAAAQTDYEKRVLSALIASTGNDGGQEVEAVAYIEPHILETLLAGGSGLFPLSSRQAPGHRPGCTVPLYVRPQPASTTLVERLTKALEPFCKHYEPWMERWDDQEASSTFSRHTFGDLREALAAINEARAALSSSQSTSREGER